MPPHSPCGDVIPSPARMLPKMPCHARKIPCSDTQCNSNCLLSNYDPYTPDPYTPLASAYFAAVWLGEGLRLTVLRRIVTKLSKRFFGVPAFHYYALADGIRTILGRVGRWVPAADDLAPPQPRLRQLSLF